MVLQSLLFGIFFVFHDKQPIGMAAEEQRQTVYLQSSDKVNGLKTTTEKKELLEALDQFLVENNLTKKKLILYGDIPALAYIFNMESAVFTTWPDLDSNPLTRLQQDLDNISNEKMMSCRWLFSVHKQLTSLSSKAASVIKSFL